MSDDSNFRFHPMEVGHFTGQAFHVVDGVPTYGLTDEPEVCGGTGNHDFQPVASCDECDPNIHDREGIL